MATVYLSRLCLVYTNSHHNFVTIFKQIGSACRKTCNSSASYYDSSFLYQTNTHCFSSLLLRQYSVYTSENSTGTLLRWTINSNELKGTDWYFKDMIVCSENGNPILGVNTFNQFDIKQVKDLVNEVALNGDYQFEIPASWLVFDFCMHKFEKKVMSLKECQNLSQECSISLGDEFNAALWFLHNKVGTIRYF